MGKSTLKHNLHICIKYTAIAQYVSHIQYRHIHITLIYAHSCSFIRDGFVLFFCFVFISSLFTESCDQKHKITFTVNQV